MGNSDSVSNSEGLNEYCYNTGYDHGSGKNTLNPDPIGDGISSLPCTLNKDANESYSKGYVSGVNSGDEYSKSNDFIFSNNNNYHDYQTSNSNNLNSNNSNINNLNNNSNNNIIKKNDNDSIISRISSHVVNGVTWHTDSITVNAYYYDDWKCWCYNDEKGRISEIVCMENLKNGKYTYYLNHTL
jgi:hypothetical protein